MLESQRFILISTASVIGLSAAMVLGDEPGGEAGEDRGYESYLGRAEVELRARHRAFEAGHPDFGATAPGGAGRYAGIAADMLDDQWRPMFKTSGQLVSEARRDASGVPIMFDRAYIEQRPGDAGGSVDEVAVGPVSSSSSFGQWFRDTAGVNSGSRGTLTMDFDGASETYRFDGPLGAGGDLGAGGATGGGGSSTYEMETTFVHQAGDGWWIEAETDADVWVYVGGNLVLDGGSGMGMSVPSAEGMDDFDIEGGVVVPGERFAAEVKVLGAAIQSSEYHMPVTMRLSIGGETFDPFGGYRDAVAGNVNDDQSATGWANPGANPRRFVVPNEFEAGSEITVEGTSWSRSWSRRSRRYAWNEYRSYGTENGTSQIKVLRNGDPVPDIEGAFSQGDVSTFVAGYVDQEKGTMLLDDNQVIYLFELGTSATSSSADFQDLVVLVTLAEDTSYFVPGGGEPEPELTRAPSMTQRIDLDRLWWLEDGRTYDLRVFFADRDGEESDLRLETNVLSLNLAQRPSLAAVGD